LNGTDLSRERLLHDRYLPGAALVTLHHLFRTNNSSVAQRHGSAAVIQQSLLRQVNDKLAVFVLV
jgi:hypothetical protein